MSLNNCIKKAGKSLNKSDAETLRQYVADGLTEDQAAAQYLADVEMTLADIASKAEQSGLEVSRTGVFWLDDSAGASESAPLPAGYGANNTVFTEDAAAKARDLLKKKLGNLNAGLDPEVMQAGMTLAGYHIEAGARSFSDYAKAMIGDLGDGIRPYLRSMYESVRHYPGFDNQGMTPAQDITDDMVSSILKNTDKKEGTDNAGQRRNDNSGSGALGDAQPEDIQSTKGDGPTQVGLSFGGEQDDGRGGKSSSDRDDGRGNMAGGQESVSADATGKPGGRGGKPGSRPASGNKPDQTGSANRPGKTESDEKPGNPKDLAENFVITDELKLGEGGAVTKYNGNIEAITLLKKIEAEGRQATGEEQKILARYVGWGGIKQAFPAPGKKAVEGWQDRADKLRELLTEQEYERAASSIQNAHYTSQDVVEGMWKMARRLGFDGGKVLESSMGVGNFFGLMPRGMMKSSSLNGIELDSITGRIAKQLYPQARVNQGGFQDFMFPPETFHLSIGNPPFGNERVFDPNFKHLNKFSIHNYFFAKSVDLLAPGGLHIEVVSRYFMDAKKSTAREYIAHRTEMVAAFRLPWTAFKGNAGTEVVTDIIILKKLPKTKWGTSDQSWATEVSEVKDPKGSQDMPVNRYFADQHPENVLGTLQRTGSMNAPDKDADGNPIPGINVDPREDSTLALDLDEAIERLPENIFDKQESIERVAGEVDESADDYAEGRLYLDNGALKQRVGTTDEGKAEVRSITPDTQWTEKTKWGKKYDRALGMVEIRDTLRRLLAAERLDDKNMDSLRRQLNRQYDVFVSEHGYVNDMANQQAFKSDPDLPLLMALEQDYSPKVTPAMAKTLGVSPRPASATKMPVFTKRVISPYMPPTSASNPADGLMVSLQETGGVDIGYIQHLTGKNRDQIIADLAEGDNPSIFFDPSADKYVMADDYLSGNVKRKHQEAMDAGLRDQAERLKSVFPPDLRAGDISVNLGAPWVGDGDYKDFFKHLTGSSPKLKQLSNGAFAIAESSGTDANERVKWGTDRMRASEIVKRIMNAKALSVFDYVDDGNGGRKAVLNAEATQLVEQKAEEIQMEFEDWLFKDPDRQKRLVDYYNEHYNTNVEARYDGSYLKLPGKTPTIELRSWQLNAVARILRDGRALLDHVVGAGKTYTIVSATMELRRLGLSKKPMIVVPNHLVEQWASDFYRLYPGAKLLAMSKKDFEKKNRRRMLGRIATGDWDAVIVSHSSFGFINNDKALVEAHLKEQIAEIQRVIDEQRSIDGKKSRTAAQYEKAKDKLKTKLKNLLDSPKDDLLTFQELGVDQLSIDESHEFKNLFFATQRQAGGFGSPDGSKKAMDLFIKSQGLLKSQNHKGMVFATGTPVSNSLVELYTMQRYMQRHELLSRGLDALDPWLNVFGVVSTEYEANVTGTKYKRKERLRKLRNVPELIAMYREFADSVSLDKIKVDYKEKTGQDFPVPRVKDPTGEGRPRQNVVVPRSTAQAMYSGDLQDRMDKLKRGGKDNALAILGDGRKAALDMRILFPGMSDNPDSKPNRAVQEIYRIYRDNDSRKGTQLVFLDMSTPSKGSDKRAAKLLKEGFSMIGMETPKDMAIDEQWSLLQQAVKDELNSAQDSLDPDEQRIEKLEKYIDQFNDIEAEVVTAHTGFSVYDDMKKKLVEQGIDEKQVAFIHDFNSDKQKSDLFDAVKGGQIRVLFGSTSKMGAGTNVQTRLVGLHHIDVPWRPSDIEQREGRIIRQGNMFREQDPDFEVEIMAYATEATSDVFFWQTQEQKLNGINSLRKFNGSRELEEVSADAMSAAEMKALASGNPLILEDVQLSDDLKKLQNRRRAFIRNQQEAIYQLDRAERNIRDLPGRITEAKQEWDVIRPYVENPYHPDREPTATLNGETVNRAEAMERAEAIVEDEKEKQGHPKKLVLKVEFDGKNYTSQSALGEAIRHKLGDADPFFAEYQGIKINRGHQYNELLEPKIKAMIAGETEEVNMGTAFGQPIAARMAPNSMDIEIEIGDDYSALFAVSDGKALPSSMYRAVRKQLELVGNRASNYEYQLDQAKINIDDYRETAAKDWNRDDEIKRIQDRLAEIRKELSAEDDKKGDKPDDNASIQLSTSGSPGGRTKADVEKIIADAVLNVRREIGLNIDVVQSVSDLPERLRSQIPAAETPDGVFDPVSGKIYIVADNTTDPVITFAHEVVGHLGMESVVDDWDSLINEALWLARSGDAYANELWNEVDERWPWLTRDSDRVKEFFAVAAERRVKEGPVGGLLRQIRVAVRKFLKKLGIKRYFRNAEIDLILNAAERYLKTGRREAGGSRQPESTMFSNDGEQAFYSKLLRSVKDAPQDKNAPEQWLGLLKKSGVKQEEIDWLGLPEWLEGRKSVPREELADFIRSNQVVVTEVMKGGNIARDNEGYVRSDLIEKYAEDMYSIKMNEGGDGYQIYDQLGDLTYDIGGTSKVYSSEEDARKDLLDAVEDKLSDMSDDRINEILGTEDGERTKYQNYQLPGGENYRELLLTLPSKKDKYDTMSRAQLTQEYESLIGHDPFSDDLSISEDEVRSILRDRNGEAGQHDANYTTRHFDTPNILAHTRFNERVDADGKRVLFIEEVQSDWHQEGKKKGYKSEDKYTVTTKHGTRRFVGSEKEAKSYIENSEEKDLNLAKEPVVNRGVPDAPFKKTWPLLAMKRMIRYAAENGFDRVAWTTGEQQAERYDLSKHLELVEVYSVGNNQYDVKGKTVGARNISSLGLATSDDNLAEIIGKELAEKAISDIENKGARPASFSGLDLKVGGEGMKGFYDNILPKTVNKYVKKWGGKVGRSTIKTTDMPMSEYEKYPEDHPYRKKNAPSVHSLDITDAMRESVMDGQPLFSQNNNAKNQSILTSGGKKNETETQGRHRDRRRSEAQAPSSTVGGRPARNGWYEATRVLSKGRPATLYRGSRSGLKPEHFDKGSLGKNTRRPSSGLGVFTTVSRRNASEYGPKVEAFHLDIRKPYKVKVENLPAFDSVEEAYAWREGLRKKGYDGIYIQMRHLGGIDNMVVFDPEQTIYADQPARFSTPKRGSTEESALRKAGLLKSQKSLAEKARETMASLKDEGMEIVKNRILEGVFDTFHGAKTAIEKSAGQLPAGQNGYIAMRLSTGLPSLLHGVLHYGHPRWKGGILTRAENTKGLLEIFEPVKDDMQAFMAWMIGRRASRFMSERRENNFSQDEIDALLAMVPEGKGHLFRRVAAEYDALKTAILDVAEESGLIDGETRPSWDHSDYIPFYRINEQVASGKSGPMGKKGFSHQSSGVRLLKGGEAALGDPLENIMQNFAHLLDASLKNHALSLTLDNLAESGMYDQIPSVEYTKAVVPMGQVKTVLKNHGMDPMMIDMLPQSALEGFAKLWAIKAPGDPDVVRVMRNGKAAYFRIHDAPLLRALTGVNQQAFDSWFMQSGRAMKRLLTGAVTAEPTFMLRNFIRDSLHSWTINEDHFKIGIDSFRGVSKSVTESGGMIDMMFAGASFMGGYLNSTDPQSMANEIRRSLSAKGYTKSEQDSYLKSAVLTAEQAWTAYRKMGDAIENANREAVYEAAEKAGKSKAQSAFEAKDLMDFSMRGNFAVFRVMTDLLPFFNARLQGMYKLGRAGAIPGFGMKKHVILRGMVLAGLSMALMAMNSDRDEYEELEDWDKDLNWHFWVGDQHYRMPKPFEIGLLFGTIPERFARNMLGKDDNEKTFRRLLWALSDTLAFNPVPQIVKPGFEVYANENAFTGRPIEGMSDEGKIESARYNEGTSETMRYIGQYISDDINLSPKQLEHLWRGYLGTLGMYVLGVSDNLVRLASDMPELPDRRIDDYPIIKAFRREDPARSTRYKTELYEMHREIDQVYRTIREYRRSGKTDAARALQLENRIKLSQRRQLSAATKKLSNIRKSIDRVYRSESMTPEEKRKKIDRLYARSNRIAERAAKRAGDKWR